MATNSLVAYGLGLTGICVVAGSASATILTFDLDGIGGAAFDIPQTYGDRVTALVDGDSHGYGLGDEGFTPNVKAGYGPTESDPDVWMSGYGTLTNVLIKNANSQPLLQITLSADPGFAVELFGFEMAAFNPSFELDPEINYIRVLDSEGAELFRDDDSLISNEGFTTFDFSTGPLVDDVLVIEFDTINLVGLSDAIGIDNIRFGQAALGLTGDLNGDGFVGIEDMDILLANWGETVAEGSLIDGDASRDGAVGSADLSIVQGNWGARVLPGGVVPEPGAFAVLGIGGMLNLRRRRAWAQRVGIA